MTISALKTIEQSPHRDELAAFSKAVGDALRLEVLCTLKNNAYSVLELCQLFDVRQPAMSHHLKVMANAGLVATRREGNTIFYRRVPMLDNLLLVNLHQALLSTVDKLQLSDELLTKISQLHIARAELSRQFFQDNVERFEANQDLIASYRDYGASVVELIDSSATNRDVCLELGAGHGELLGELSPRFKQVYALDNVQELLNTSRIAVREQGLSNVEFLLGDITDKSLDLPKSDCITLNMVLHHLPQPAEIFTSLAAQLNSNGVLVITDLCHHEQQWVKESCGDLWQGFAPEDLNQWAEAAGLSEGQSLYLALRNGFRIQLRVFKKFLKTT